MARQLAKKAARKRPSSKSKDDEMIDAETTERPKANKIATAMRLDQELLDRLDAYIKKQRFPTDRTAIVTVLLEELLDDDDAQEAAKAKRKN